MILPEMLAPPEMIVKESAKLSPPVLVKSVLEFPMLVIILVFISKSPEGLYGPDRVP